MKMFTKWLFATTLLLAVVSGCEKRSPERKDPLDEGYVLIDRGDYSAAIENLQTLSEKDSRPKVKVALASAYAARGGVKVTKYWGFVFGFRDPREKPVTDNPASTWQFYRERVDAIPVVTDQALLDVKSAVDVLSEVKTPGGRLYRAILDLILFKSYVVASPTVGQNFTKILNGDVKALCAVDGKVLAAWLEPVTYHLNETLSDLMIAFPEKQDEFAQTQESVQKIYDSAHTSSADLKLKKVCP